MHKVLPLRSWTVLPAVTVLFAASGQSAMANHNHGAHAGHGPGANQFRAHSLNINNNRNRASVLPNWSSFVSDAGTTKSISRKIDFDLSSTRANITLGTKLFSSQDSVTIDVGGTQKTLTANSTVTPAEYVAALQKLDGAQSLVIGGDGKGVGGSFDLDSINNAGKSIRASELVVPQGVTGVGNFGHNSDFRVLGDLVNDGTVYALSNNPSNNVATISARNVINDSTGVISSAVPVSVSSAYGSTLSKVDLRLKADLDIKNAGSITSSGSLALTAGGSITNSHGATASAVNDVNILAGSGSVTNGGTISSNNGNINFASSVSAQDLNVTNTGGTLQALNGDINFRDPSYADIGNINFSGGNLYSQQVNLNSGTGTANLGANDVTGLVNVNAACAHILAATSDLKLGTQNLTGDPTYYSVVGSIDISSSIATNGADLAIIAGGDVTSSAGASIKTDGIGGGNAGNILIVAGANITATSPVSSSGSNDTTTTVTFSNSLVNPENGSASGGKIDFSAGGAVTALGGSTGKTNGGNITMVAYLGTTGGSGVINLNNGTTLVSSSPNSGTNGDITLIAGSNTGTTITTNTIQTSGSAGSGNVFIATSTPLITGGGGSISVLNGTVQPGSGSFSASGLQTGAGINVPNITINQANLTIKSGQTMSSPIVTGFVNAITLITGGDLNIANSITAPGGITLTANGNVRTTAGGGIDSSNSTGNGGPITITAGAGGGANFGDVDFTTNAIGLFDSHSSATNGSGGNIQIIANNFGNNGGRVILPNNIDLTSGGSGAGNNGNINITATSVADQSTAISMGGMDTTGGAKNGTGSITLSTPGGGMTITRQLTTDSANITATAGANIFLNIISGNGSTVLNAAAGQVLQLDFTSVNQIIGTSQNLTGNGILIKGGLTAPGGILLVSKTEIDTSQANHVFSTATSTGDAGNITMIAGANFLQDASTITVQGASTNGGQIDMSTIPLTGINTSTSKFGSKGGAIELIAYDGNNVHGKILFSQSSFITTGGSGGTSPIGSLLVVSGTNNNTTGIQLGNININGSSGGGTVTLLTETPNGSVASPVVISTSTITRTTGNFLGTNLFTLGDIATKNITALGGNVFVHSGRQVQLGGINVNAPGAVGDGGSITVISESSTVLNVVGAGANSIQNLSADGGSTSGNGGSFTVQNVGTGGVTLGAFSVPFVVDGQGGSVTLDADQGTLTLPTQLIVNGKGTNNDGGFISIKGKVISNPVLLAANGVGTGNGGTIFVEQTGTATTIVDNTHFQAFATGNGGGTVSFKSGGILSVDVTAIGVAPTGSNGKGGTIFLTGTKVSNALGGTLVLDVSAQKGGTGDGGTAEVHLTNAATTAKVSAGADYQFIANSGTLGGNGGTAVLLSNNSITVDQSGVNVDPLGSNGNGGVVAMNAGISGSGDLLVDGDLSALGRGTGTGGALILQSNSGNAFTLRTDSKPINGVFGTLSTGSKGTSGTITITNSGGGISVLESLANENTLNLTASGNISTNSSLGGKKTTHTMTIQTSSGGFTSVNPKAVLTALDSITFNITGPTGSVNIPITFNSSALQFTGTASAFLVNKAKGPLVLNSSSCNGNFTLTTAGNIENGNLVPTGVALTDNGGLVTLTSTKGGLGTTGSLLTKVNDLSFNTKKGLVDITNSGTGQLSLEDSNAGGIINISSSIDIGIVGSIGTTKSNVTLMATGTANIQNDGGIINGSSVNLTSFNSSIGDLANGPVSVNAANLLANAGTSISLIDNASSVTLGDMTANNGDLTVKTGATTSTLMVAQNSVVNSVNGTVVLQQSNTTKGKITLAANSFVRTTGTGGDVYIYIGSALPGKNNPITSGANIVVDNQNPLLGQVYVGNNGITAQSPDNVLTTIGRDIVFDTGGLSSKNILLGGGVKVTADPPLPAGLAIAPKELVSPIAVTGTLDAPVNETVPLLVGTSPTPTAPIMVSTPLANLNQIEMTSASPMILSTPDIQYTNVALTIGTLPTVASNGGATLLMTDTAPLAAGAVEPGTAPSDDRFTLIDATFVGDNGLGIETVNGETNKITLQNGKTLFAPNVDTDVKTPFGTIRIDAKSLVFVVLNKHTLAVYNLDDDHRSAVSVSVGKHAKTLSPGRHVVITSKSARDFESINPCESFAYRALDCTDLQNGLKTFHGQFHVPVAVASVKQLRELVTSRHPGAKRVAQHLMKTTAILMHLQPNQSDYQLKRAPETTAWLN